MDVGNIPGGIGRGQVGKVVKPKLVISNAGIGVNIPMGGGVVAPVQIVRPQPGIPKLSRPPAVPKTPPFNGLPNIGPAIRPPTSLPKEPPIPTTTIRTVPTTSSSVIQKTKQPIGVPTMGSVTDLIGTIATGYFNSRTPQPVSYGQPSIYPMQPYSGSINPMYVGADEAFGIPGFDVVGTSDKKGMVYDPNGNCGAGKWIKRRRRRRKVLVTNSEIAGLAKLKGVVGAGATMKEWIATHS